MSNPAPQAAGISEFLKGAHKMLLSTLKDFSDADMMVRPVPRANHAAWQIAHLTHVEASMLAALAPERAVELPAGFAERIKDPANNDAAAFGNKEQLLGLYTKVRTGLADAVAGMTSEQLQAPTPKPFDQFEPKVESLMFMVPVHATMHLGQFQVIRRKLEKPMLM